MCGCETRRDVSCLPVSEDIGETEVLMISERVQIQEVADVDVLHAKRIRSVVVVPCRRRLCAGRVVIDLISDITSRSVTHKYSRAGNRN